MDGWICGFREEVSRLSRKRGREVSREEWREVGR